MRTDPSYEDYLAQWSALYEGKNYDEGLAGYFLAKSHQWCESAFGPDRHFGRVLEVGAGTGISAKCAEAGGIDLVELPQAESCCGFGGTFAVKNPDTSAAMLADKMHHVLSTGAEVCSASDSSCLLHIGGGLSRLRAGVRTVHLAEILASTRTEQPEVPAR